MIKASEGGGGKGIRRAEHAENFTALFQQVQGTLPPPRDPALCVGLRPQNPALCAGLRPQDPALCAGPAS